MEAPGSRVVLRWVQGMSWIKMRTDLRTHPKVVRMASALKADKLRVVGGLWAVWAIFDTHSVDGLLEGYTLAAIDDELAWRGFGAAMQSIGWLEQSESGLAVPEFDTHNGASAKRRATDAKLKQSNRSADKTANGSWTASGQMSASDADKNTTVKRTRVREEKEKNSLSESRARGARLPPDWSPDPEGMAFAEQQGLRNGRALAELGRFRDYWTAQPGQKGVKTDWPATWRNWVRRASENPPKPGQGQAEDIFAGAH